MKRCEWCKGIMWPWQKTTGNHHRICATINKIVDEEFKKAAKELEEQFPQLKHKSITNCPIIEQTGDGKSVGRCWFHLPDGKTCPRHGNAKIAINHLKETGHYMLEKEFYQKRDC